MASSPVIGTFSTSKDTQRKSPAPSLMQRMPSSRGRQNSTQSLAQEIRNRPASSTSNKATASNGVTGPTSDAKKVASDNARTVSDTKLLTKIASNPRAEHPFGEDGAGDGDLHLGLPVGSRGTDKSMKKENLDPAINDSRHERPPSISISTRGGGGGKVSKTSTPTQGSFTESHRTRPVRNSEPAKRSHKKGAGLAAQLAAAQLAHEEDGSSMQGDDDEEDGDSEPRYCYCNQVSYGEMVACDMDSCPREWFHLDCVGLAKAPRGNGMFDIFDESPALLTGF
ncbi:MAG: hypothetical protein Q9201_007276 [Fulgogasparrea decipioides]